MIFKKLIKENILFDDVTKLLKFGFLLANLFQSLL